MMQLDNIRALAEQDMKAVNALIQQQVSSDVALINQLGFYIINSGGKRIRPLITVLAARAASIKGDAHHTLAAIIEFIHTSTLLHDDVVDESTMRRGKETANAVFGNQASVLVGDFLYSRSFQMMVSLNSMRVMEVLSDATNRIAQGEVQQLMNCNDPNTTEASYFDVIYGKTGRLFEAATHLAGVLAGVDEKTENALLLYGRYLGNAFQLADDIMDYVSDSDDMGKNTGDDLAEGKPTLPLLYAMWNASETDASLIRDAIENANGLEHFERITEIMKNTGALAYTQKKADEAVDKAVSALAPLADGPFKEALIAIAFIAGKRSS